MLAFRRGWKRAGKKMLGKGQRKEHARLLTRVGMCAGKKCSQMCQRALTQKQTLRGRFECPSSLLERLQGRIALEALCERRSSLGSEVVVTETAVGVQRRVVSRVSGR